MSPAPRSASGNAPGPPTRTAAPCPRDEEGTPEPGAYAALLAYYLGDGCISRLARTHSLRVSCDAGYPGIIEDVSALLSQVHPTRPVFHVSATGCVAVQSYWKHWPCLFPQHGPGRKHERVLGMQDWQWTIVEEHPGDFLRGLFHSDGCRLTNWTVQAVAGEPKRYEYPRWQFTNHSEEIRQWCGEALDLAGIAWRPMNRWTLSVARREAVAALDDLIGPKR